MISILHIDDEKLFLEISKIYLEKDGDFSVDTISSPIGALDVINSNQYDIIISDYEMPGMNGIELLKKVRSTIGNIPFILFTGRGREDVAIAAINNGVDFYVQKGGDPRSQFADLRHQVKQAVAKRKAEEELFRKNEELQAAYEEIVSVEEELRTNYNELTLSKQALEVSEKRYALTLESINDGLWDYNISSGVLFLSPQFYRMCGYEPGAFAPDFEHWISLIHPNDQERVRSHFIKTLEHGDNFAIEYRVKQRDNTYFWILARGKVVEWNPDGIAARIVGTHTDITARKEIEEKLEEKSRVLQTLTDNLPGMVYRCKNDADWTMMVISDGVFSLTGYKKEEMLFNRDISYGSVIHPEDQQKVWDFVEDGIIKNRPFQLNYRIICKDGSIKWVWEQGRGVFQEDVLVAIEGYIADITPETIAQNALKKLAHSIEHLKEGIFWFNNEGIIYDTNITFSEFLFQSKEKVIQSHVSTLPFILQSNTWDELMNLAKTTGSTSEIALLNGTQDDQKNLQISISYGQFGDEGIFCGIINDRTKEEKYLNQVLKSREELASAYEELLSSEESLKDQYFQLAKTKEALQESEHKYRSIFQDAILGIFKETKDGSIIDVNPAFARIHGFDTPEELKATITDVKNQMYVHPEDFDKLFHLLEVNGEVRGFETEKYRKDGSIIWISINEKVIRKEDGKIHFLEGTIDDITRRKKVESENEISLNQLKKNFAEFSILNDGIRNPLTILAILAESCDPVTSNNIFYYINQIDDLIKQLDTRWLESDKVLTYLQKHHNY